MNKNFFVHPREPSICSHMTFRKGIKISLTGTAIEALGLVLDIMHHIDIGIKTPEGLLTPFHFIIFIGFLVNFVGVLLTLMFSSDKR